MAIIGGTGGDDYLIGTEEPDTISAGEGNDSAFGNGGDDVINGDAGDDGLAGGEGDDRLYGGTGNDSLQGYLGNDEAYGEGGNDNMNGDLGDDVLDGGAGDDEISGASGHDTIRGGADADRLVGGYGEDHVDGGDGDDWIAASTWFDDFDDDTDADVLAGGGGNDRLWAGYGDSVDGGTGTDVVYLSFYRNGTAGVTADLSQLANNGTVTVAGGTLTNIEYVGSISLTVFDDHVVAGPIPAGTTGIRMDGWDGNDDLTGTAGVDAVHGGEGDDVIRGGGGYSASWPGLGGWLPSGVYGDDLRGGGGDDIVHAGADGAVASGDDGNDVVHGGAGHDILQGDLGNDVLRGGGGDDDLQGWLGDDLMTGGEGTDSFRGHAGVDTVDYSQESGSLGAIVNLSAFIYSGPGTGGGLQSQRAIDTYGNVETVVEIENVIGSAGDDTIYGNSSANRFEGAAGDDVLDGGGGLDVLIGGTGDDAYGVWIHDGPFQASIVELAGGGTDAIETNVAAFSLAGLAEIENLTGYNNGGQNLTGNGLANTITGAGGSDTIDGGAGADTMRGSVGSDVYLVDNEGDLVDELAGEGTDEIRTSLASYGLAALPNVENLTGTSSAGQVLTGNAGNNVVTGGGGNDVLRLDNGGNDTANGGAGNDNIFFIGSLTSADVVNGGGGVDTLVVQGPYGSLTLTANVTQIENVSILGGNNTNFGEPGTNRYDYGLTTSDANFAAGVQARINASALLAGEDFTFDGSAETDAKFVVYGGKGADTLTGGQGNDIFFFAEDRFASGDTVNGGAGYDGMFLRGFYIIDFNAPGYTGLFTNIENLTLTSATDERYARGGGTEFDYNLILADAIVGAGQTLTVSGALLTANETMVVVGNQEADGFLRLFGGAANDTLIGGANADLIHGYLGADEIQGGGGADIFRYLATAESNGAAGSTDRILDFAPGTDRIELDRIDANTLVAGDQAFTLIGSNAFTGSAGQLRVHESGPFWIVEGDVNGDGVADLYIGLDKLGPTPPGPGDFVL